MDELNVDEICLTFNKEIKLVFEATVGSEVCKTLGAAVALFSINMSGQKVDSNEGEYERVCVGAKVNEAAGIKVLVLFKDIVEDRVLIFVGSSEGTVELLNEGSVNIDEFDELKLGAEIGRNDGIYNELFRPDDSVDNESV